MPKTKQPKPTEATEEVELIEKAEPVKRRFATRPTIADYVQEKLCVMHHAEVGPQTKWTKVQKERYKKTAICPDCQATITGWD